MNIKYCQIDLEENFHQPSATENQFFPCAAYYTDIRSHLGGELPWHWHKEVEIVMVKKGTVTFALPEIEIHLKAGDGLFINSQMLHSAVTVDKEPAILHSILFKGHFLASGEESLIYQKYIHPLLTSSHIPYFLLDIEMKKHFELAFTTLEERPFAYEMTVRNHLSHLWHLFIQQDFPEGLTKGKSSQRLKQMLTFIHENYEKNLSLSHVAESASVSTRECLRSFKENLGISPMKYLLKHRLRRGSLLLLTTDYDITTIAHLVGIESPSYFSKTFKAHFGMTPSEYRKAHS